MQISSLIHANRGYLVGVVFLSFFPLFWTITEKGWKEEYEQGSKCLAVLLSSLPTGIQDITPEIARSVLKSGRISASSSPATYHTSVHYLGYPIPHLSLAKNTNNLSPENCDTNTHLLDNQDNAPT